MYYPQPERPIEVQKSTANTNYPKKKGKKKEHPYNSRRKMRAIKGSHRMN
jgi:hypothetical protein